MIIEKYRILVVGAIPPPLHGVAVATSVVLTSSLSELFVLEHLDLSDRRGIEHVDNPDIYDVILFIKQWFSLIGIIIRKRPSVIYIPISQSSIGFIRDSFLMWPALVSGAKVVFHLHGGNFGSWFESRGQVMKMYTKYVLRWVSNVIVLGNSLKSNFNGLVRMDKISVVPNGLAWPPIISSGAVKKDKRYRILSVGTLSRFKGTLVLLKSIPKVISVRTDVEFILVGQWLSKEDEAEAHRIIQENNLSCYVSFTGVIENQEKHNIFRSADLFVFSGIQQEGQPLVAIEAMAAGLPVLYTDRGCLAETVPDHVCGLMVRSNDPEDLAEKIVWMLENPGEMDRMGANGRERYLELYTTEQFTRKLGDVLLHVANGRI